MKCLFILCLLICINSFGQTYILENERVGYSFKTTNGKTLMVAIDSNERYLVYRFGTDSLIELEYPKNLNNSWRKFKYAYWMRGGGPENIGMDINFLYFNVGHYRYVVYAEFNESNCGIKVINTITGIETNILGDMNTVKGSLVASFRWNELITAGDELFE